jgi:hypothetical protein
MMRTVLQEKNGQVQMIREMLAKNPTGNATQRKQQLKSGWVPNWRPAEKSALKDLVSDFGYQKGRTTEGREIEAENNAVATSYAIVAETTVSEIEEQLSRFSI